MGCDFHLWLTNSEKPLSNKVESLSYIPECYTKELWNVGNAAEWSLDNVCDSDMKARKI